MKKILLAIALLALPSLAHAQSNPHLTQGQVLTPAQWNNLFVGKQDTLGYTPMNNAGGTFTGRVVTAAPGASTSGFNLTPGSTPASPANGDLWVTSAGFFTRVNGATINVTGGGAPLAIGTTPIIGGAGGSFLYVNGSVLGQASLIPAGVISYVNPYVGAVTRSQQQVNQQEIWATEFDLVIPDGTTDIGPGLRQMTGSGTIPLGAKIKFPVGNFFLNSCVGDDGFGLSQASVRDNPISIDGTTPAGYLGGTVFLLGSGIPDTCDPIQLAGTNNLLGRSLSNFSMRPAAGFYAAGVGRHGIHINGAGYPDYFEYNFRVENVQIGNMKTGRSFKTFSSPNAPIIAGISGTTMTVTSVGSGAIFVGSNVVNVSGVTIARVTALGTGTGGTGTYTITPSQTVAPGTALIALGNNGGGALNNASIEHSVLMSVQLKNVGDSVMFYHDTVGQGELRGDPGYRWDQVSGATSIRIHSGLIANVNGMVVVDGGVFPSITGNVEFEMSNVANAQGCLIDFTGATTQVIGGLVEGNSISQNSSVGTIYSICIRNADNIKVVSNRIATTAATPPHLLNTAASTNLSFNGNSCWTNNVVADCAALNSSGSINSQKVNIGTVSGTDLLNVLGFANFSAIRLTGAGTYNLFGSGAGAIIFPNGTSDFSVSGGANQIVQQPTLGGPFLIGAMTTTINGTVCTTGSSCTPPASSIVVGSTTVTSGTTHGVLTNNGTLGNTAAGTSGQLLLGVTGAEPAWGAMSGGASITNAGVVTVLINANLTGAVTSTGNATLLGSFSSASLLAALTTSTGIGNAVFSNGPTFTGTITAAAAVFSGSVTLPSPIINGLPTGTGVATANTVSTLVARNGSGDFAAGTITAALNGNATTATSAISATNASNGATVAISTNASFFPLFAASSTNSNQPFNLDTTFTYNPSTDTLTVTNIAGNASTASAVAVGGITGLGTNVATALAINVGSAGSFITNGGALGSPSSAGTLPAHTLGGTISGGGNQINNIVIGAATPLAGTFTTLVATTVNGNTITTGTGVLTLGAGKTATVSNTMTFTATDGSSIAFGTGGTVAYTANNLSVFAATTSAQLAGVLSDETGSGVAVFANSPALITPDIGAATGTSLTASGLVRGSAGSGGQALIAKSTDNTQDVGLSFQGTGSQIGAITQNGNTGVMAFKYIGGFNSTWMSAAYATGAVTLASTTASTSKTTGALIVGGGLGVAGATFTDTMSVITMASDTGQADNSVCINSAGLLLKGTGTLGICLGTSSGQFKHDIVPMGAGLAELIQLAPKNFFYDKGFGDDGHRQQYGLIAEEVVKVLPGITSPDRDGKPLSVDLLALVPVMINALKQLKAENDNFRSEMSEFKKRNLQ